MTAVVIGYRRVPPSRIEFGVALRLYDEDRVTEAYNAALDAGLGEEGEYALWFRQIEAEAVTRARSTVRKIDDYLEVEFIPAEAWMGVDSLTGLAQGSIQAVCDRLGWKSQARTRVTVLAKDVDTPFATNPDGFCVRKNEFFKICIPAYVLEDEVELSAAISHEYVHVVSMLTGGEYVEPWFDEGVAVHLAGERDDEILQEIRLGRWPWLSPRELNFKVRSDEADFEDADSVLAAYQQAGLVVGEVVSVVGEPALLKVFERSQKHSFWRMLLLTATGTTAFDSALKSVTGKSKPWFFEQARRRLFG